MKCCCLQCKGEIEMPDLAPPTILNSPLKSVIVIDHAQATLCPHCGIETLPIVMNASLAIAAAPAPPTQDKPLIVGPGGLRIQ